MFSAATVLGALGETGSLVSRSLIGSSIKVTEVDIRARIHDSEADFLQADVVKVGPDLATQIQTADCIFLCLPEEVALVTAPALAARMAPGTLWVDTLSVKSNIVGLLQPHTDRLEILSINPMFAPALGWAGKAVGVVEISKGSKADFVKGLLLSWGASIELLTADEHDRVTAAVQVATHAAVISFGAALINLGYDPHAAMRLATPPHRLVLTLLHRIITQNPEVYWEIQHQHPHAAAARDSLISAIQKLNDDVKGGSKDSFHSLFSAVSSLLSQERETLARWSKEVLAAVAVR
jgi:prephenate dehydrogenase